jgi:serine/threonine protein kinase
LEKKRITQLGFHDKFRLVRKLGSGASGAIVYEVKRVRDNKKFALKCFEKKKCFNMKDGKKSVENEIKIMS